MPNILTLTAENAGELLNAGAYGTGAVFRVQSSTTETGTFADISGTGSTPTVALVDGTRSYTAYDPSGTSSTWYRTRFENSGATRVSDWTAAFQVGAEEAGFLCSIYDVEQRLTGTITANNRELLIEFIRDASTDIEGYCDRWFSPRPLSGTTTYLFSPAVTGRRLFVPKGVRSISAIGYATTDQPDTGGTFTSITATNVSLQPGPIDRTPGWPPTTVVALDTTGTVFYAGINRVTITGSFGFATVPADIAGIAANVVIRRFTARGSGVSMAVATDDFAGRLLRWISPEEHDTLTRYRAVPVA